MKTDAGGVPGIGGGAGDFGRFAGKNHVPVVPAASEEPTLETMDTSPPEVNTNVAAGAGGVDSIGGGAGGPAASEEPVLKTIDTGPPEMNADATTESLTVESFVANLSKFNTDLESKNAGHVPFLTGGLEAGGGGGGGDGEGRTGEVPVSIQASGVDVDDDLTEGTLTTLGMELDGGADLKDSEKAQPSISNQSPFFANPANNQADNEMGVSHADKEEESNVASPESTRAEISNSPPNEDTGVPKTTTTTEVVEAAGVEGAGQRPSMPRTLDGAQQGVAPSFAQQWDGNGYANKNERSLIPRQSTAPAQEETPMQVDMATVENETTAALPEGPPAAPGPVLGKKQATSLGIGSQVEAKTPKLSAPPAFPPSMAHGKTPGVSTSNVATDLAGDVVHNQAPQPVLNANHGTSVSPKDSVDPAAKTNQAVPQNTNPPSSVLRKGHSAVPRSAAAPGSNQLAPRNTHPPSSSLLAGRAMAPRGGGDTMQGGPRNKNPAPPFLLKGRAAAPRGAINADKEDQPPVNAPENAEKTQLSCKEGVDSNDDQNSIVIPGVPEATADTNTMARSGDGGTKNSGNFSANPAGGDRGKGLEVNQGASKPSSGHDDIVIPGITDVANVNTASFSNDGRVTNLQNSWTNLGEDAVAPHKARVSLSPQPGHNAHSNQNQNMQYESAPSLPAGTNGLKSTVQNPNYQKSNLRNTQPNNTSNIRGIFKNKTEKVSFSLPKTTKPTTFTEDATRPRSATPSAITPDHRRNGAQKQAAVSSFGRQSDLMGPTKKNTVSPIPHKSVPPSTGVIATQYDHGAVDGACPRPNSVYSPPPSTARDEVTPKVSNATMDKYNAAFQTDETFEELLEQFVADIQEGNDLYDKGQRDLLELEVDLSHAFAGVLRYRESYMDLEKEIESIQAMSEATLAEEMEEPNSLG